MSENIPNIPIVKHPGFRPWVQKVMPGVYDDTLSYYELLAKVVAYLNQMNDQQNEIIDWIHSTMDEQNKDIEMLKKLFITFRGDMVRLYEEFTKQITTRQDDFEQRLLNEILSGKVSEVLNQWFDNGKLAEIINKDVFDMKADKQDLVDFEKKVNDDFATLTEQINAKVQELINQTNEKVGAYISVTQFSGTDQEKFEKAIKYCVDQAKNKGIQTVPSIIIPGTKKYTLTATLVKPLFVKFVPIGMVLIDYTGDGAMIHHKNPLDVVDYRSGYSQMPFNTGDHGSHGKMIIKGKGKTEGQTAYLIGELEMQSIHNTHTAWSSFKDTYIEGFAVGIEFSNQQNYIMRFDNITIAGCGTCVRDKDVATNNSGEAIEWINCAFHNSDKFLEINREINHTFTGCSIDYNTRGVEIKNARYRQLEFVSCWIEASNTPEQYAFVEATTGSKPNTSHVKLTGGMLYPRSKIGDVMFKGGMTLSIRDVSIEVNRFTQKNLGSGATLCDNAVEIAHASGCVFHDNPVVISTKLALNYNGDFEVGANGDATVKGFSKVDGAGQSAYQIDTTKQYSGNNSLKVLGNGTYLNLISDKFPLRGQRIYGTARVWIPSTKTTLNVKTTLFYQDFAGNEIGKTEFVQNMNVGADGGDKWYTIPSGTSAQPLNIPPGSYTCQYRIDFGGLSEAFWVDDLVLTVM